MGRTFLCPQALLEQLPSAPPSSYSTPWRGIGAECISTAVASYDESEPIIPKSIVSQTVGEASEVERCSAFPCLWLSSTPNTFCRRIKVHEKLNLPTYAFYTHNPGLDKDTCGALHRERGEFGTPFVYISPIDLISKSHNRRKSFVESELEIKANTCNNDMDSQTQGSVPWESDICAA